MLLKYMLRLFGYDSTDPVNQQELEVTEEKTASGLVLPSISRRGFLLGAGSSVALAAVGVKVFSFPKPKSLHYLGVDYGFDKPAYVLYGGAKGGGKTLTIEMLRRAQQHVIKCLGQPSFEFPPVVHPSQLLAWKKLQPLRKEANHGS